MIITNNTQRMGIWDRNVCEVAKWSSTLSRVITIQDVLFDSSPKNAEIKKKTIESWLSFHKELTTKNIPESIASKKLNDALFLFPEFLRKIYREDFDSIQGNMTHRINRLVKDVFSAVHLSVKESFQGNQGVLLLRHTRAGVDGADQWVEKSVIKWTSPLEIASSDILSTLLDDVYVHKASLLAFKNKVFIKQNLNEEISAEYHPIIEKNLNYIRKMYSTKESEQTSVMIAERVKGSNLVEFIVTQWSCLNKDQKEKIFTGIGKLALADLLMGNGDRFTQFNFIDGFADYFDANIGNLMIHLTDEGNLILNAIDNEIQAANIETGSDYEQYNLLFKQILSDLNWKEIISDAIINSLSNSCRLSSSYYEETEMDRVLVTQKLKTFLEEVKTPETRQCIMNGLLKMHDSLHIKFTDEGFIATIEKIKDKYSAIQDDPNLPHLYNAIKTRINIFLKNDDLIN